MSSLLERVRGLLSPSARTDRRNIDSLAKRLGMPVEDAAVIYRRSRAVGFGAAMTEYEGRCRERAGEPPPET
jgi:hypothetical protein